MRPDASENSQISSSTIVWAARAAGSHPHLASVLQQGRKRANICVSLRVIRGIPVKVKSPTNAADYVIMGGLGVIGPEKFTQYFTGHFAAAQAYAWSSPMEGSNKRRFFAVFASATNYVARRSRKG